MRLPRSPSATLADRTGEGGPSRTQLRMKIVSAIVARGSPLLTQANESSSNDLERFLFFLSLRRSRTKRLAASAPFLSPAECRQIYPPNSWNLHMSLLRQMVKWPTSGSDPSLSNDFLRSSVHAVKKIGFFLIPC